MADAISFSADLFKQQGMKPDVLEDINVAWGRNIAANTAANRRRTNYDPEVMFSQALFSEYFFEDGVTL